MWIQSLELKNIRSFKDEKITFSKGINLIVGSNNSGKSTIIGSIARFQNVGPLNRQNSRRVGTTESYAAIHLADAQKYFDLAEETMESDLDGHPITSKTTGKQLPYKESDYFIYPFLSHRKVDRYSQSVKKSEADRVRDDNSNLTYRLLELSNSTNTAHQEYEDFSKDILNFSVSNVIEEQGPTPGIYSEGGTILLEDMGDGVGMLTGFLSRLAGASGRLFLIEEPENDLHPKALKKLLGLIIRASEYNQFIISTHSNLVVRILGGAKDATIISLHKPVPIDSLTKVDYVKTIEDKNNVLVELGYEVNDLDSFDAWLFFEEASMEELVRRYLIPTFTPKLNGIVRTFSSRGASKLTSRLEELNSLFVFMNLESKYKNRAWVVVDGGKNETAILNELKQTYVGNGQKGWTEDRFIQLTKHSLEDYYPENFQTERAKITSDLDFSIKRVLKTNLLKSFLKWAEEDREAKKVTEDKFAEIITHLRSVEKALYT